MQPSGQLRLSAAADPFAELLSAARGPQPRPRTVQRAGADRPAEPQLVTGVFTRKGECEHHEPGHPLNLLWDALKRQADAESSR